MSLYWFGVLDTHTHCMRMSTHISETACPNDLRQVFFLVLEKWFFSLADKHGHWESDGSLTRYKSKRGIDQVFRVLLDYCYSRRRPTQNHFYLSFYHFCLSLYAFWFVSGSSNISNMHDGYFFWYDRELYWNFSWMISQSTVILFITVWII